jgi:hypothetical protein
VDVEAIQQLRQRQSTRTCKKLIRFTSEELTRVRARASAAGRPVACFIRESAVGSRKRLGEVPSSNAALIHQLAQVATSLRAVRDAAMSLNLDGCADFDRVFESLMDLIRGID